MWIRYILEICLFIWKCEIYSYWVWNLYMKQINIHAFLLYDLSLTEYSVFCCALPLRNPHKAKSTTPSTMKNRRLSSKLDSFCNLWKYKLVCTCWAISLGRKKKTQEILRQFLKTQCSCQLPAHKHVETGVLSTWCLSCFTPAEALPGTRYGFAVARITTSFSVLYNWD